MGKELTGFKKTAPSNKNDLTSAWDLDTSPFHRLVDQQNRNNRELIDEFLKRIEIFSTKLDDFTVTFKQSQKSKDVISKKNIKQFLEFGQELNAINKQLSKIQTCVIKDFPVYTENIQKKLDILIETFKKTDQASSFNDQKAAFEKWLNGIDKAKLVLDDINTAIKFNVKKQDMLEKKFIDLVETQNKTFQKIEHHFERITVSIEILNTKVQNIENIWENLLKEQKIKDKEGKQRQKYGNIIFLVFMIIFIFFALWVALAEF